MQRLEGIRTRRSIRRFKDIEVPRDLVLKAVDSAKYYPSWKNTQTARFMLIENKELKSKIADCVLGFTHNTEIINNAPSLIIVLTIKGRSGYERDGSPTTSKGSHFESFDAGLATQNLMLSLHNEGIGSVVLGIYDEDKIKKLLELDDTYSISCLLPIGYKVEDAVCPMRHTNEEFLIIK